MVTSLTCDDVILLLGVKKKNECTRKSKKNDKLAMHYTVSFT